MAQLSFTTAPVEVTKQIKKQKAVIAKGIKAKFSRRKVDMGATVYGDELFQAAYRPTKAIVVKFHPFTLNLIRVEVEGRFAIQYYNKTDEFLLYRFLTPITYEWSELEYQIPITENVKTYGPFEHVESIRDKILEILKRQLLEERAANKQLAIDLENKEKLAKEKAQDEAEKIAEQLGNTGISSNNESSQRETKIESKESEKENELLQETSKEANNSQLSLDEIRKPTTSFLKEVGKVTDLKDLDKLVVLEETKEVEELNDEILKTALQEADDNKIVTIWKREGTQVKLIVKMPKSKAEKWIAGRANFYIK